jgi:hypothetical protein
VVVISPNQIKNLRGRYGSAGNKDDRFDAYVLADTLAFPPSRPIAASFVPGEPLGPVRIALGPVDRAGTVPALDAGTGDGPPAMRR